MKTIKFYIVIGVVTLLATARVDAATIFAPTDGDVNFLFGDLGGGILAMFDDSDQSYLGASLAVPVPSIVGIAGPIGSGDYIATNELAATLILTGSSNFILGLSIDGGTSWLADSSVTPLGANSYSVAFNNGGNLLAVDVQVVPVPAAAWLFGTGLVGLMGMSFRRKHKHTRRFRSPY